MSRHTDIKTPLVSVIIPTKNSYCTISQCLNSLRKQTYDNIEIIIVDNHSTDATLTIAHNFTDKVFTMGPERSSQVNFGVTKASGKYIYRVDSDFVLESDTISESVKIAELNDYAAVLIHNTSDPTIGFWAKVRKFERDMYQEDDLNVAVRFVRRDIFLLVGGLDPDLHFAEDYDLHNRIVRNYRIGRTNAKEVHIGEYRSIKEIASRYYYYGKSIGLFLRKNKLRGVQQVTPLRKSYLKHYKEFFKHPHLTGGFIIYQIVRYFSILVGLLATRIQKSSYTKTLV